MMDRKLADWSAGIDAGHKPVMVLSAPRPLWHMLRTISSEMELGAINLKRLAAEFKQPVDTVANDVIEQWISAGLLTRCGDWLLQTVAGQFWHVTLAQLLVDIIAKRLPDAQIKMPAGMPSLMGHPGHPHHG